MIGERCEGMDTFKIVKQDSYFGLLVFWTLIFFYLSQVLSVNSHYLKNDWYVFQEQTYVRFEQIEEIFIWVLSYCIAFPLNEFGIIIFLNLFQWNVTYPNAREMRYVEITNVSVRVATSETASRSVRVLNIFLQIKLYTMKILLFVIVIIVVLNINLSFRILRMLQ